MRKPDFKFCDSQKVGTSKFRHQPLKVAAASIIGFAIWIATATVGQAKAPTPSSAEVENQNSKAATAPKSCILLQATVSDLVYPQLETRLNELVNIALERQADSDYLNQKQKHFHGPVAVIWAGSRDILELMTEYKGFEQSSEAGDIILGEKLKIKSKASADYAKQLRKDFVERSLYMSLAQMAEGLGCSDSAQAKEETDQSLAFMKTLEGEDEANKTLQAMKDWCGAIKIEPSAFEAKPLSVLSTESQSKFVLDSLMKNDAVIAEIKQTVHKRFNRRSNVARVTAKVMNFGLSVANYSPTWISPASEIAWAVYIATQGGPEESKLLKEVYLDKRFENRYKTLDALSDLAVNSHNTALLTKNPALLAVSEWMIDRAGNVRQMPIASKPGDVANATSPNGDTVNAAQTPPSPDSVKSIAESATVE